MRQCHHTNRKRVLVVDIMKRGALHKYKCLDCDHTYILTFMASDINDRRMDYLKKAVNAIDLLTSDL